MSRPTLDEALAALEAIKIVTVCDCARNESGYYDCRHTTLPELVLNPELYRLWYDYCDATQRTGSKRSPEAQDARHRLEDAVDLAKREIAGYRS